MAGAITTGQVGCRRGAPGGGRLLAEPPRVHTFGSMSPDRVPAAEQARTGHSWIDEISDEECMEIFWLYVDPPEPFLAAYPPQLLGAAMRYALRAVVGEGAKIT